MIAVIVTGLFIMMCMALVASHAWHEKSKQQAARLEKCRICADDALRAFARGDAKRAEELVEDISEGLRCMPELAKEE